METWTQSLIHWLLVTLALPKVGLSAIFFVSLMSATLLPLGSEPAVFGFVKLTPHMFWPAVLVATLGNTIGGAISYAMGIGAEKAYEIWHQKHEEHLRASLQAEGEPTPEQRREHALRHPVRKKAGGRWHLRISQWAHRIGPAVLLFSWIPVVGDPLCAVAGWLRLSFWPCVLYMAVGKFLRYTVMTAALLWLFPSTV